MVPKHSRFFVLVSLLLALSASAVIRPSCADEYDQCKIENCPILCIPDAAMTPACTACADANCKKDYEDCQKADEPAPVVLSCEDEHDKCEKGHCPTQCNKDHEEMTPECKTCLDTHCKAKYHTCLKMSEESTRDSPIDPSADLLVNPPVDPPCLGLYDECAEIHCPTLCNEAGKETHVCKTCADPHCKKNYDQCRATTSLAVTTTNGTSLHAPVKAPCASEYDKCEKDNCTMCNPEVQMSAECNTCVADHCKKGYLDCKKALRETAPSITPEAAATTETLAEIIADDTPPVMSVCDTEYDQCRTDKCPAKCIKDVPMTPECKTCVNENCLQELDACVKTLKGSASVTKSQTTKNDGKSFEVGQ